MNVCVCVCVRERRRWRKERFRERDGADSLRIRRVSPPALMHFAVKEHACQAAKIDDGLRRMWRRQKVLFCLLMFLISSPPDISLFQRDMLLPSSKKNASYAAYFPFSQFPPLPSSSL